jgi:hypothetical protein
MSDALRLNPFRPRLHCPGPVRAHTAAELRELERRARTLPLRRPTFASQTIVQTSNNGNVKTSTATNTSFSSGTLPSWGSGTGGGSYLGAFLAFTGNPGTITAPSGWSAHRSILQSGSSPYVATYEIVGASSRSGTEAFTWANGVNGACCVMVEISGTATSSPQDGSDATNSGSTSPMAAGTLSTGNANDAVLGIIGGASTSTTGFAPSSPTPSGFSVVYEDAFFKIGATVYSNICIALVYNVVSATGNYTPGCTAGAGTPLNYVGLTYAVKAASIFVGDDGGESGLSYSCQW